MTKRRLIVGASMTDDTLLRSPTRSPVAGRASRSTTRPLRRSARSSRVRRRRGVQPSVEGPVRRRRPHSGRRRTSRGHDDQTHRVERGAAYSRGGRASAGCRSPDRPPRRAVRRRTRRGSGIARRRPQELGESRPSDRRRRRLDPARRLPRPVRGKLHRSVTGARPDLRPREATPDRLSCEVGPQAPALDRCARTRRRASPGTAP